MTDSKKQLRLEELLGDLNKFHIDRVHFHGDTAIQEALKFAEYVDIETYHLSFDRCGNRVKWSYNIDCNQYVLIVGDKNK